MYIKINNKYYIYLTNFLFTYLKETPFLKGETFKEYHQLINRLNNLIIDNYSSKLDTSICKLVFLNAFEWQNRDLNLLDVLIQKHRLTLNRSDAIVIESTLGYSSNNNVNGYRLIIGKNNKIGSCFKKSAKNLNLNFKGIFTPAELYSVTRQKSIYKIKLLNHPMPLLIKIKTPVVIIENMFLSNEYDKNWLYQNLEDNLNLLVENIFLGIQAFLDKGDNKNGC